MKLIDILVQELPKLGGWPIGADRIYQNAKGHLVGVQGCIISPVDMGLAILAEDLHKSVAREQYEAAFASSKQEWDGEGLPPVGVNAEVLFADDTEPKWYSFLAKYIGENHVVALVGLEEVSYKISELCTKDVKFAPVRSEEDRKRDESVIAIYDEYLQCATVEKMKYVFYALYDAIAAGKIPHIRID